MENTLTNPEPYPFTHVGVTSPQKVQIFQGEFGARADLPHVRVAIMLAFITPSDNPEPLSRLKSPVGLANSTAPHCCRVKYTLFVFRVRCANTYYINSAATRRAARKPPPETREVENRRRNSNLRPSTGRHLPFWASDRAKNSLGASLLAPLHAP